MFPIHMDLGFNKFPFYEGLYFAIAIVLGVILCHRSVRKDSRIKIDQFDSFTIWVLIGAIAGGRLSNYIFWNTEMLLTQPWTIFFVWQGGISITGGLGGGILAAWLFAKIKKFPFWTTYTHLAAPVLFSQALGRLGCFLNGDAFGIQTNLPWGVQFPKYGRTFPSFKLDTSIPSHAWRWAFDNNLVAQNVDKTPPLHPTQIYEALGGLALLGIILLVLKSVKKGKLSEKIIFFIHVGGYTLLRFLMEFIRGDRENVISAINLSGMQLTLLGLFVVSMVFIVKYLFAGKTLAKV